MISIARQHHVVLGILEPFQIVVFKVKDPPVRPHFWPGCVTHEFDKHIAPLNPSGEGAFMHLLSSVVAEAAEMSLKVVNTPLNPSLVKISKI